MAKEKDPAEIIEVIAQSTRVSQRGRAQGPGAPAISPCTARQWLLSGAPDRSPVQTVGQAR